MLEDEVPQPKAHAHVPQSKVKTKTPSRKAVKARARSRARARDDAEDDLRRARKIFVEIRSLRVRERRMHRDMVKLCNIAWKEGVRSAPAGGNRRYCLRDPADGGGFYFLNLASGVEERPSNVTEKHLGEAIHDWQKRAEAMTRRIAERQGELPSTERLYELLGVIL